MGDLVATPQMDSQDSSSATHKLAQKWTLWAHLPHDVDWSIKSYKRILDFDNVETAISLTETLPATLVKNCMLFLMRDGVMPTWEHSRNCEGGSFSYKVSNKLVPSTWRNLTYTLVGETLALNESVMTSINGITISPKKNFCVVKIWTAHSRNQDPSTIASVEPSISPVGCLFRRHNPK
jgi:hypothetical protein